MDCFDLLAQLPDECIDLAFLDPPYNTGIFCKMPRDEYLLWCEQWITECSRVLKLNGAFWVSHSSPIVLARISEMITLHGRSLINWVTWDKYNWAYVRKFKTAGTRSFIDASEYLVYHTDEGDWIAQCDRVRGFIFEPLRAYLATEIERSGISLGKMPDILGYKSGDWIVKHYIERCQWRMPTPEHYANLRSGLNQNNHGGEYLRREYEDLRREYEDLRREYEDLRYTFNTPEKMSSIWQFPPAIPNGHLTPKPERLLERIVKTTSNPNDLVLDFFAGSFTTAVVAEKLGRRWMCCDNNAKWVELGQKRLREARQLEMTL
jgi:DNA modification methylase